MPKILLDNLNWFFDGVGVAFGAWLLVLIYKRIVLLKDGNQIYKWLKTNTQDEPNESHKTLLEISIGVRLSSERVQEACRQNKKIYQSTKKPGNYSIWRSEFQSVYDKRGIRSL